MKIVSSEYLQDMFCTQIFVFVFFQHSEQFGYTTCSADVASFWKRFTCNIFNEPDIETLIKLKVRESLVVLHLAAELSLNPVCKLSSTAPKGGVHKLRLQDLSFFDHLPSSVYIFYGIKVYKKYFFDQLPEIL